MKEMYSLVRLSNRFTQLFRATVIQNPTAVSGWLGVEINSSIINKKVGFEVFSWLSVESNKRLEEWKKTNGIQKKGFNFTTWHRMKPAQKNHSPLNSTQYYLLAATSYLLTFLELQEVSLFVLPFNQPIPNCSK